MQSKGVILIVDDEPVGRDTVEALLSGQGYTLAFADSGMDALTKAAQIVPDLILLDVMMPGLDGFDVCRRLRADPILAEVPIIMVTALDDHDSRLRGIQAGADDFVTKPFDRAELRARVATVTRLNRYRLLVAERSKFEWVVEHASDGYLLVGTRDQILYANAQARLYLNLPESVAWVRPATPAERDGIRQEPETENFRRVAQKLYQCEPQASWERWPMLPGDAAGTPLYLVRPESSRAGAFWLQVDVLEPLSGGGMERVIRLRNTTAQITQRRDIHTFHRAISHKLRTPLTGLLGGLDLLVHAADQLTPDETVEFAETARTSARRLMQALADILGYLGAAGVARADEQFVLGEMEALVQDAGAVEGLVSIRLALPEDLRTLCVLLSRKATELILWELFENARKFHPQQSPTIDVSVCRFDEERISIQVADDGVNLAPEHLQKLWTPYYQGEKFFTGEQGGLGLGLATVGAMVWEVGGTCRAINRVDGPGVIVELLVPLEVDGEGAS